MRGLHSKHFTDNFSLCFRHGLVFSWLFPAAGQEQVQSRISHIYTCADHHYHTFLLDNLSSKIPTAPKLRLWGV